MPCSDWLTKGSICLLCLISFLCSDLEGRSYEKCTAEDGRLGYCVAIIYCRQGQSQRLLRCQGANDNYCCPLPAPQTSATEKPRRHIVERPRRPADDENLFGHEDRSRPSGPRIDPEQDGERPRRPPHDRTASGSGDRSRPSRPRFDTELDGKPVDERPRRPSSSSGEDRSRPRYDPERNGRPVEERPRGPTNDRTPLDDVDRRPSRPRYDTKLDDRPYYETPRRPTNDRTPFDDENRRPPRPRYDPELDARPIDERPIIDNGGLGKDRSEPSGPRYDSEPDDNDSPYFTKPKDVGKSRDTFGDGNEKPRGSSGRFPDSSGSRRPEISSRPGDTRDPGGRMPPRRGSRPEQPYRPGESNGYDSGQPRPVPIDPESNSRRPSDRTGSTDQGSRGPVIRFPDRQRDRTRDDKGRGETRRGDESKVSDGRRVDEDRTRSRSENPRRDDRPPSRGVGDTSKANATANRTPDTRVPQLPKIPGCGVRPYKLFIAGGEVSDDHQWPWMAAIFRRFPDSRPKAFLCGGSLINTRFVLTAAHCFVNNYVILAASYFVVRLGSNYLSSGEEYTVEKLVLHHNHSGSDYFNDIALIRLAGEVAVTDKIAPICLPTHQMALMDMVGLTATVAGWGDVEYRTSGTRLLQHVTIPIVSNQECSSAYSRVRGAAFLARGSDHIVCAGLKEGGKDACLGDSGGPLMLEINDDQWVVIGVVSLGYKCAEPGYYGVYTRVTHYTPWIDGHLRQRH